jgi:hypothetical protein
MRPLSSNPAVSARTGHRIAGCCILSAERNRRVDHAPAVLDLVLTDPDLGAIETPASHESREGATKHCDRAAT